MGLSFETDTTRDTLLDTKESINSKPLKAKSSNLQASLTLFKIFVGSGILALPASFAKVGFFPAFLGTIIVAFLTYYGMLLLIKVMEDLDSEGSMTLQKLAGILLGKWGKLSVEISLLLMQIGATVAGLIFARKFLNHVSCSLQYDSVCNNDTIFTLLAVPIIIPLSFITNVHYFYYPSLAATFFIFVNVCTQIYYNFHLIDLNEHPGQILWDRITDVDMAQLPSFFGVAVYAFEGIGVIFSVRSAMQKPQCFPEVIRRIMYVIGLLYVVFAATSVLAFGKNIEHIILFSQPATNGFFLSAQGLYVLAALLTYPLALYPAVHILENSFGMDKRLFDSHGDCKNPILRYGMRVGLAFIMLLIAIKTKSFTDFVNLLGSGVFVYLGFLLPVVLYHVQFRGKITIPVALANGTTFVLSSILGALGIIVSLRDLS